MKAFIRNFGLGIPLAVGAMLTLIGVSLALESGDERFLGFLSGLIGIPTLFASLASLGRDW